MTVGTLSLAQQFRAAELSSTQAEALATAIGRSVPEGSATKADLLSLRTELKADIDTLEHRVMERIEAFRSLMLVWFVATQIAVGGLIVALVKL